MRVLTRDELMIIKLTDFDLVKKYETLIAHPSYSSINAIPDSRKFLGFVVEEFPPGLPYDVYGMETTFGRVIPVWSVIETPNGKLEYSVVFYSRTFDRFVKAFDSLEAREDFLNEDQPFNRL